MKVNVFAIAVLVRGEFVFKKQKKQGTHCIHKVPTWRSQDRPILKLSSLSSFLILMETNWKLMTEIIKSTQNFLRRHRQKSQLLFSYIYYYDIFI